MHVGVISDTHNQLDRTRRAVELLLAANVGAIVHCGDFTRPEIVAVCAARPLWFVFGNNDSDAVPELKQAAKETNAICLGWGGEFELAGRRIAVTHGHFHVDVRRLLAQQPDYLLFGHSHLALHDRDGAVRRVNPGALHRAANYSVAVLDLDAAEVRFIPVPR